MWQCNKRHISVKPRSDFSNVAASAADLKSLAHARQNWVQGLQIESGTRIIGLLVPITFQVRESVAAIDHELRKVGTVQLAMSLFARSHIRS